MIINLAKTGDTVITEKAQFQNLWPNSSVTIRDNSFLFTVETVSYNDVNLQLRRP